MAVRKLKADPPFLYSLQHPLLHSLARACAAAHDQRSSELAARITLRDLGLVRAVLNIRIGCGRGEGELRQPMASQPSYRRAEAEAAGHTQQQDRARPNL